MTTSRIARDLSDGLRWLVARMHGFLFAPMTAAEVGWIRMAFYGAVLLLSFVAQRDFPLWSSVDEVFRRPMLFGRLLHIRAGSETLLTAILWCWRVALAFAALGWLTRASTFLSAVIGIYVLALPHTFSKVSHNDAMLVLGMVFFALSACGEGWSIDSLIARARRAGQGLPNGSAVAISTAGWVVQLLRLMITLVFFTAGLAKLRASGLVEWASPENLSLQALRHYYTHRPAGNLGAIIAGQPWITGGLAIATFVVELGAPLLLVLGGRWQLLGLAMLVSMMAGFGFILGVMFWALFLLVLIMFLPWRRIGAFLAARWPGERMEVLYDGSCGICRQTMAVLRGVDVLGRVRIRDAIGEWPQITGDHPAVRQEDCLNVMHAFTDDGRVFTGYAAYRQLAHVVPLLWPVLPLLYVPPVPWFGNRIYARVARSRFLAGCRIP